MINFKVTHAADQKPTLDAGEGAAVLWQEGALRIEGTKPLDQWKNESGDMFLLLGHVVGIRQADGRLMSPHSIGLRHDVAAQPSKSSRLEGRYVIIKASAGNGCEIWTDPFGHIDVYYQTSPGQVVIGSSLGQMPIAKTGGPVDQVAAAHSLVVYGSRPAKKQTLYKDVKRLGIGETLRLANGKIEISARPFEPVKIAEYRPHDLHRYADIFLEGVRARASGQLNIVSLSSGWDSTSILASLVHLFGNRNLQAVIARLHYSDRSGVINQFEIDRAKAVADYFSVPLDILDYDFGTNGSKYLNEAKGVLRANQLMSISGLGNYHLYRHVAKQYAGIDKVYFTGEMSDGAHNFGFSQYATMFHPGSYEFREYADKMGCFLFGPTFLKELYDGKQERDPVWKMIRGMNAGKFDEPAKDRAGIHKQILASQFLRKDRTPFSSLDNTKLLTPAGRQAYAEESDKLYLSGTESFGPENMYSWYLHLYNSFYWQSTPPRARQIMADTHDVTIANPFQDSALIDFLSAMPESWGRGLNLNPTKYPLKWMLANRIDYPTHLQVGPHSYTYDVVEGFSISGELLHASDLRHVFRDSLKQQSFISSLDSAMFDLGYIERIVKPYVDGSELRGEELGDVFAVAAHSAIGVYGNA